MVEDYCWAITQALWQSCSGWLNSVGFWISTGLPCIYMDLLLLLLPFILFLPLLLLLFSSSSSSSSFFSFSSSLSSPPPPPFYSTSSSSSSSSLALWFIIFPIAGILRHLLRMWTPAWRVKYFASLCPAFHAKSVQHEWPYQQLGYC